VELIDRSGVAEGSLTVSGAVLTLLSLMNGRRSRPDIQAEFLRRTGRMLFSDELDGLITEMDQARFLAGPGYETRWKELTREYRDGPMRTLRDAEALGAPPDRLSKYLEAILTGEPASQGVSLAARDAGRRAEAGKLVGLIAPHLDYARGGPCYAAAYHDLADRTDARRFVILGTNHFGRGGGVVGTRKDFQTPWGVAAHDEAFMRRVDERCGARLCDFEYDHVGEHSVELQVVLLAHLLQDRGYSIAPYLCSDPCGATDTNPHDDRGAILREFAQALRAEIDADDTPTCVIAGADLSHVGRYFNDPHELGEEYLGAVERSDRAALARVIEGEAEAFRASVAETNNATNICSVGCVFAIATAMNGRASPALVHYHQAIVEKLQNCVTCAAIAYVAE
jgi:hypothetical protein